MLSVILWQFTACTSKDVDMELSTEAWINIGLSVLIIVCGAIWAVMSIMNKSRSEVEREKNETARVNEASKNAAFRDAITKEVESLRTNQGDRDALVLDQLGQMSEAMSDQLKTVVASMKEISEDMKDSAALHEENKVVDKQQQVEIEHLQADVKDHNSRILTLERNCKICG